MNIDEHLIMKIRLNKYLADSGICSRRKADEQILSGNVKVNGKVAALGQKIDSEKDKVNYLDKPIESRPDTIVYALNKPKGIISTASDEKGRKSVIDLVPSEPRVYPVGRLDKESEGLILLTNDGEFAQELSHPSKGCEKEYYVVVRSLKPEVRDKNISTQFLKGYKIDGKIMHAKIEEISILRSSVFGLRLVLCTGYNRQIRKMCAKMGLEVTKLKRTRIGNLKLEDLNIAPGEFKIVHKQNFQHR